LSFFCKLSLVKKNDDGVDVRVAFSVSQHQSHNGIAKFEKHSTVSTQAALWD